MQLSSVIVDFYLFCDGLVDMQVRVPLTRNQCRVSDTLVTDKARAPPVTCMIQISKYDLGKHNFVYITYILNSNLYENWGTTFTSTLLNSRLISFCVFVSYVKLSH